jgi:uncharacterized protein YqhQ
MEADIAISIALVTGFVLFINQVGRIMRAYAMHKTIREALSRDSNLTPELLDRIEQDKSRSFGDGRIGIVLVAIAVGIIIFGLIEGDSSGIRESFQIAIFPLLVGSALLGRLWYLRNRGEQS